MLFAIFWEEMYLFIKNLTLVSLQTLDCIISRMNETKSPSNTNFYDSVKEFASGLVGGWA